jgi:hypothetical protein
MLLPRPWRTTAIWTQIQLVAIKPLKTSSTYTNLFQHDRNQDLRGSCSGTPNSPSLSALIGTEHRRVPSHFLHAMAMCSDSPYLASCPSLFAFEFRCVIPLVHFLVQVAGAISPQLDRRVAIRGLTQAHGHAWGRSIHGTRHRVPPFAQPRPNPTVDF